MVYGADHKVRLGYTSSGRFCIYIGETTSSWAYPQIIVRDVIVGYTETAYTYWKNAWTIGFATTLENVTATCSNYALTTKNYGSLVATKSHTHSNLIIQGKRIELNGKEDRYDPITSKIKLSIKTFLASRVVAASCNAS